jgi:hypothetical protein
LDSRFQSSANFLNRFSGPGGALEMPSDGDVSMLLLLTALAGKQPESAPEIGFSQRLLTERPRYAGDEVLPFQ